MPETSEIIGQGPLRNVLGRAALRGERQLGGWEIGNMVDGRDCFISSSCRIVTSIPSHLVCDGTVTVSVDLPAGTVIEAVRVKFLVPQSNSPKIAADFIQWHAEPSPLSLDAPATIISFGFDLGPELFPGCLLRRYPAIRKKPDHPLGINPVHYMALGAMTQEALQDTFEHLSPEDVELAMHEEMDEVTDEEMIASILQKGPQDIEGDDYLALIRYRTPTEIATACNKLFLGDYNLEMVKLPAVLAPFYRKLQGRRRAY